MITAIRDNQMTIKCPCGASRTENINLEVKAYDTQFDEYSNYMTGACPECGTIEGYNLNLSPDPDEEDTIDNLSTDEEVQRYYVRLLQRIVREDFVK